MYDYAPYNYIYIIITFTTSCPVFIFFNVIYMIMLCHVHQEKSSFSKHWKTESWIAATWEKLWKMHSNYSLRRDLHRNIPVASMTRGRTLNPHLKGLCRHPLNSLDVHQVWVNSFTVTHHRLRHWAEKTYSVVASSLMLRRCLQWASSGSSIRQAATRFGGTSVVSYTKTLALVDFQHTALIKCMRVSLWMKTTPKPALWVNLQKKDRNLMTPVPRIPCPWRFQWRRLSQCQACREGALTLWCHSGFLWSVEGGVGSGWNPRYSCLYNISIVFAMLQCVGWFVVCVGVGVWGMWADLHGMKESSAVCYWLCTVCWKFLNELKPRSHVLQIFDMIWKKVLAKLCKTFFQKSTTVRD